MTEQGTTEVPIEAVQLKRAHLENQKLDLEIKALERGSRGDPSLARLVPFVSVMLAFAGFAWGVFQYKDQQQQNREVEKKQQAKEEETAQREAMKPWIENQREIYKQALSAAGTLVTAKDAKVRQAAENDFFRLYHGPMILVETTSVSEAMVSFGRCIDGTETCSPAELNSRCHILGTTMARSMAATAKMTYEQFKSNQFEYRNGAAEMP